MHGIEFFLAAATLAAVATSGHETDSVRLPAGPSVVTSYSLRLKEAPDEIIASNDGHVWVVSNAAGAFIQIDVLTGARSSYKFDKGGAVVTHAVAGDDGSLWYLDGLNTEDIWRIGSDGDFRGVTFRDSTHVLATALASNDGGETAAILSSGVLMTFDEHGPLEYYALPQVYHGRGPLALSADGTIWFGRDDGIAWRTPENAFNSADVGDESDLTACGGHAAAALSWMTDPHHHVDDYRISWIDAGGRSQSVRRWPAPPPPTPASKPTYHAQVVSCGICGGGLTRMPPHRSRRLLSCTPTTAWVQIDDSLDWLASNGDIRSFRLSDLIGSGGEVQPNDFPDAPRVWVYSVESQQLVELQLR